MTVDKPKRLAQAAKFFNVGISTIVDFLKSKGLGIENKPNSLITDEMYTLLAKEYKVEINIREEADQITLGLSRKENPEEQPIVVVEKTPTPEVVVEKKEEVVSAPKVETKPEEEVPVKEEVVESKKEEASSDNSFIPTKVEKLEGAKIIGKIDLSKPTKKKAEEKPVAKEEPKKNIEEKPVEKAKEVEAPKKEKVEEKPVVKEEPKPEHTVEEVIHHKTVYEKLEGPKILGKIELKAEPKPETAEERKKRKRIQPNKPNTGAPGTNNRIKLDNTKPQDRFGKKPSPFQKGGDNKSNAPRKDPNKPEQISEKEIQDKIKMTMARLAGDSSKNRQKIRRGKRSEMAEKQLRNQEEVNDKLLKITEFISVSEIASLMGVNVGEVIKTCMSLGVIVSINQRLDAEIIELVASEFGFEVEFISVEDSTSFEEEEEDSPESLVPRAPIVTIMGHVDHGKTSLLDYIRKANVLKGEAGGITQHIGAYDVLVPKLDRKITFLDTPGHEAFTAMRARGAKLTDIAVIVIAADDKVMPQTKEAISHAQSAGVPMIFALNKIDKPGANPEGVRTQLSEMNLLVESWGGKYQDQEISAKQGLNVELLLEKILLEADLLELKANPNKLGSGTIIEASLDKGRGYVTTLLVTGGTLEVGDFIVAGSYYGKIKALTDHTGKKLKKVGPGQPAQVLGLNGAPTAGEKFRVFEDEQEAKQLALKRGQIEREQGMRTRKHITLDEIGRRLALGTFKELNVIVKGDVDGSVEALTDSLQKLSTEEIQVNVLHKAVGAITESDVLLASASDAIIIGFQVRPSSQARALAEKESIDVRHYSVIYQAIDEIKAAMEGMLEPTTEEKIVANVEIREVFKIPKIGTIAGCYVLEGKITRQSKVRLIREGIVIHTGTLASLKRYKDDAKEVVKGMECGLNIEKYDNIQVGDIVEAFDVIEVKRKL